MPCAAPNPPPTRPVPRSRACASCRIRSARTSRPTPRPSPASTPRCRSAAGCCWPPASCRALASAALALTVVPGSLGGHTFWTESDPQRKADERRAFLTDISLIGGLIIAAVDTEGKPSLGWRGRRAARKVSEAVSRRPARRCGHRRRTRRQRAGREGGPRTAGRRRTRPRTGPRRPRTRQPNWPRSPANAAPELAEVARERSARDWPKSPASAAPNWPTWRANGRRVRRHRPRPQRQELADVARERDPELQMPPGP